MKLTHHYRKLNQSSTKVEDSEVLKLPLTDPKLKKITLHFPLGLEVVARNMKGVTIKDALDAIHKQMKKRVRIPLSKDGFAVVSLSRRSHSHPPNETDSFQADDELDKPYLAGFEWDPEDCYTRFIVHQCAQPTSSSSSAPGGGKKKKKNATIAEEGS
jgi:hypothetical protein